jgi:hypothetical protein
MSFLRQAWGLEKNVNNDLDCSFSILFAGVVDSVIPNSCFKKMMAAVREVFSCFNYIK